MPGQVPGHQLDKSPENGTDGKPPPFLKKNIPSVLSLLCHKKFLLKKKYIPSVLS